MEGSAKGKELKNSSFFFYNKEKWYVLRNPGGKIWFKEQTPSS